MKYYVTAWLGGLENDVEDCYDTKEEAIKVAKERNGDGDLWRVNDENGKEVPLE